MSDPAKRSPLWLVKLGGDVVADPDALAGLVRDLAEVLSEGTRIVIVHGGGPQASRLMKSLDLEPNFVGGRRITDESTLSAVVKAVAGEVSTALAAALTAASVPALGVTGVSSGLVRAAKRAPRRVLGSSELVDFGLVGDVVEVRADRIQAILQAGFVPVIGCLASDGAGQVLNVNGDVVAVDLAVAMGAEILFSISGVSGVLRDPQDPDSRIEVMKDESIREAVADGTITGGMVAKVEESLRAIANGVGQVIIAGPPRRGLLKDVVAGTAGTRIEAGS